MPDTFSNGITTDQRVVGRIGEVAGRPLAWAAPFKTPRRTVPTGVPVKATLLSRSSTVGIAVLHGDGGEVGMQILHYGRKGLADVIVVVPARNNEQRSAGQ